MRWNGKNFRAPGKKISVYPKPQNDIRELLKPLGEKTWKGNVWVPILNQPLNIQKETQVPVVSPSPTPTITPSPSSTPPPPSPSLTPTPTPSPSVVPFDADAALYLADVISAGGSVDATMSAATDTLFTSLKSNNLYDKLRVFYPLIGSTSGSTSIMGKRVSGSTYDISWTNVGSITFNASGVTGNGSTTYGDTNFNGNSEISSSNGAASHLSVYVGSGVFGPRSEMGTRTNGNWIMAISYDNYYYGWQYTSAGSGLQYLNTTYTGYYIQTRTSDTSLKAFKNGSIADTRTYTETNPIPNSTVKVLYDGSLYSNRRLQFISIGEGLDDTEAGNLTTIINTFQTALGRNVY